MTALSARGLIEAALSAGISPVTADARGHPDPGSERSAPPLFDFIADLLPGWMVRESPLTMDMIRRACDAESARLHSQPQLQWWMHFTHDLLFAPKEYADESPKQKNPAEARVVLMADAAKLVLQTSKYSANITAAQKESLRGVGMMLTMMACHANCEPPSPQMYNEFAMRFLYQDLDRGDINAHALKLNDMISICDEQIAASVERQTKSEFYNPINYHGVTKNDLDRVIHAQCRHMTWDQLAHALEDGVSILGRPRHPTDSIETTRTADLAWLVHLTGKNVLFGMAIQGANTAQTGGGRTMAGKRVEIETRFAIPLSQKTRIM